MLSRGFGGAERLFVDLCRALSGQGAQVLAVCHRDFVQRRQIEGLPGVEVAPIRVRGPWDPWARWRLRERLRHFQPSVIHCHLARGAWFCGPAARALGIPLAANLHNYVKLKYYRDVELFLPGTRDQRRYLEAHNIAAQRIEVIPHFSLLPAVEHATEPAGPALVFVSLGRLVHKKGFDVLLTAFRTLLDRGCEARLLIGGSGPEQDRLLRQARDLRLESAVSFAGWIEDVPGFLSRGHVFVLPSRDEPFGIVALEAMACGKPIVSTRCQGPLEVLDDTLAYLADPGDPDTLARAMSAAAADHDERRRKGRQALDRYRDRYSADAVIPRFLTAYRRLADRVYRR